jgi:hypothetical protein
VSITNGGFSGDAAEVAQQAIGATEGFAYVLAALKPLFEHGLRLNIVGLLIEAIFSRQPCRPLSEVVYRRPPRS